MKLFDKQSLALLVSVVTINVLCIIAVSYAYFTTQIKGNDTAQPITVVMGSMKIKYEDSDLVTLDNAIPGDYLTNKFRITNTGTLDATYNLKIDVIENNFRDKGDLEYTLRRNGQQVDNGTLPYTDGYILVNQTITTDGVDNYELEVKFKEDLVDKNQNDNKNRKLDFKIVVDSNEEAEKYVYVPLYKDNSGANIPELYQGLIPIYYNESNQIVIADVTQEWYNYDEHEWANAVLIDHTNKDIVNKFYNEDGTLKDGDVVTTDDILQMYVWIPRYKYQLFNAVAGETSEPQEINIEFEIGEDATGNVSCEYINQENGTIEEICKNAENGEWYTHPAFTFGDTELGGIWVGKFEPSETDSNITILPNKVSVTHKGFQESFTLARNVENNFQYNLNINEIDTHMMKNMEWGAVAYLSHSKYGTCSSDSCSEIFANNTNIGKEGFSNQKSAITGCSGLNADAAAYYNATSCENDNTWDKNENKASTTGNIYGIYDMNGGSFELVGGISLEDKSRIPEQYSKYFDVYDFSDIYGNMIKSKLGDAIRETLFSIGNPESFGWYGDWLRFPIGSHGPVITRSGRAHDGNGKSGIFASNWEEIIPMYWESFRDVITAQDGVD